MIFIQVERRGSEAVDIDLGGGAKKDAVLVDEVDLAVGGQLAVDL